MNSNMALDEALGGWQMSGTFVVQGGNPMGVTTGGGNTSGNLSGSNTQEAILLGSYKKPWQSYNLKTHSYIGPTYQYHSLNAWFNDNVEAPGDQPGSQPWENPSDYTNHYGTFRRNQIYGPGLTSVNFSLEKTFALVPSENVNFEFRASATNILNHPSFGQPGNNQIFNNAPETITSVTIGGRVWQFVGRLSF